MARLYADENFDYSVVAHLCQLGHDVLTTQEAGQAQQRIPDPVVLASASGLSRAVLTFNRRHFILLHSRISPHSGIIVCTKDDDSADLASSIDQAIQTVGNRENQLLRVTLPPATP